MLPFFRNRLGQRHRALSSKFSIFGNGTGFLFSCSQHSTLSIRFREKMSKNRSFKNSINAHDTIRIFETQLFRMKYSAVSPGELLYVSKRLRVANTTKVSVRLSTAIDVGKDTIFVFHCSIVLRRLEARATIDDTCHSIRCRCWRVMSMCDGLEWTDSMLQSILFCNCTLSKLVMSLAWRRDTNPTDSQYS